MNFYQVVVHTSAWRSYSRQFFPTNHRLWKFSWNPRSHWWRLRDRQERWKVYWVYRHIKYYTIGLPSEPVLIPKEKHRAIDSCILAESFVLILALVQSSLYHVSNKWPPERSCRCSKWGGIIQVFVWLRIPFKISWLTNKLPGGNFFPLWPPRRSQSQ